MAKAHEDSSTKLSHKDLQIYARNLVSTLLEEHLNKGGFDEDLAPYSKDYRRRIMFQLRLLVFQMNGVAGSTLPPEKAEQPTEVTTTKEST